MKLEWQASGTGAGFYVDLYKAEGTDVIIGSLREGDAIRKQIAEVFNGKPAEPGRWCPDGTVLVPLSLDEAKMMNLLSERFLRQHAAQAQS